MLDAHPRIAVPFESHLYNRFGPLARGLGDLNDPAKRARLVAEILDTEIMRHWAPPPSQEATLAAVRRPDFHGIVEALLGSWARERGKSRWGEKTPNHTLLWPTIRAGFPDMQVIHLVRDGRDVALSFRATPFGPKHIYYQARRWVEYVSAADQAGEALGAGAFLALRYEDLVEQPEPELRRLCDFLGEAFSPAMLTFYRTENGYPTDRRNEANLRKPLLPDNTEKWRTRLSARELRIFEAVAGHLLDRHGYPRSQTDPKMPAWESLACRFLESPPRRALSMLRNRRAHRQALEDLRFRLAMRSGR